MPHPSGQVNGSNPTLIQAISVAFEFTAPYGTYGTRTCAMCHVSFCCTACFCYIVSLLYLVMMANLDSESDDQWEGGSGNYDGEDRNYHYGPYQYSYKNGDYSERPYRFVSPSFPPHYRLCESASTIYTPRRFYPGSQSESDPSSSSYEIEVRCRPTCKVALIGKHCVCVFL